MAQIVVWIDDDLSRHLDRLVDTGIVESRSDAVRRGLQALVDHGRREAIGTAIVEGYRRLPQTDGDLDWTDDMSRAMIAEEPW